MIEIVFGSKAHEFSIRQTLFSLIGQWPTVDSTQHCFTSLTNVFFFFFFTFFTDFFGGGGVIDYYLHIHSFTSNSMLKLWLVWLVWFNWVFVRDLRFS